MTHVEKLDRVLKLLYDHYKFEDVELNSVIQSHQSLAGLIKEDEAMVLAQRLIDEKLISGTATYTGIDIQLTSLGIQYCEETSFSAQLPLIRLFQPISNADVILKKLEDILSSLNDHKEMAALQSSSIAGFLDEIADDIKNNHRPEPSKYLQLIKKLSQVNGAQSLLSKALELIPDEAL